MRNIIRFRLKRYLFRWDTFAAAIINIIIGFISGTALIMLYQEESRPRYEDYFFPAAYLTALFCTMSAVMITELNNLSNGAVRNQLIAGYAKLQIYLSSFFTVMLYSIVQGALMVLPTYFFGRQYISGENAGTYSAHFIITLILIYPVVSCAALTVCLLCNKSNTAVLICAVTVMVLFMSGLFVDKRLDEAQYKSNYYHRIKENMMYVESPEREALDICQCFSPIQPVFDLTDYYISAGRKAEELEIIHKNPQRKYQYRVYTPYRLEIDSKKARYTEHTDRIPIFMYCQTALMILTGTVGAFAFRRRDLK
jgi:hypothetical protein